MVLKGMLNLISGVFRIFKTPSLGVLNRTLWWFIVGRFRLMVRGSRDMMNWGMMNNSMVNWSCMVDWGYSMVDKSSWGSMVGGLRGMVHRAFVVDWLNRTICWGWGVTIHLSISLRFGVSISMGTGNCNSGENLK